MRRMTTGATSSAAGGRGEGGGDTSGTGGVGGSGGTPTGSLCAGRAENYLECFECLCSQNGVGCYSYLLAVDKYFYCGSACGDTCDAYCLSIDKGMKDLALITSTCMDCVGALGSDAPDASDFDYHCFFVNTDCAAFAQAIEDCPTP